MAERVIYEDVERRVIRWTPDDKQPGEPGYSESDRLEWKEGSSGANADSLRQTLIDALAGLDSKATWDALTATQKLEAARLVLRALARLGLARLDRG